MTFFFFITLFSGTAVFIYGLMLLSTTLENNFSDRISKVLLSCTSNRFSGVLTGTLVTAAMQSSSASSVMTAAFAASGALPLYNAFWIIVGANIGTTVTPVLTAVDFSEIAVGACIIGVILTAFSKNEKADAAGRCLIGFGLLFVGMNMISAAVADAADSQVLKSFLVSCRSPLTGVLAGTAFTAVIQSSAACTAILQTLAGEGLIDTDAAFFIILGSNIGTCFTSVIACFSLGEKAAKVTLMHILFNAGGTLIFLIISAFMPLSVLFAPVMPADIRSQTAVFHVLFNAVSAIAAMCLPVRGMGRLITKCAGQRANCKFSRKSRKTV